MKSDSGGRNASDDRQIVSEDIPNAIRSDRDKLLMMDQERRVRREIANSNERRRMQSINAGFESLRSLLPHAEDEKMSKAAILQHAAEYFYVLEQEKTRLLAQNCQLKRLLSQSQSQLDDRFQLTGVTNPTSGGGGGSAAVANTICSETSETAGHAGTDPDVDKSLFINIIPQQGHPQPPTSTRVSKRVVDVPKIGNATNISLPPIQVNSTTSQTPSTATDLSMSATSTSGSGNVVIGLSGPKKRRFADQVGQSQSVVASTLHQLAGSHTKSTLVVTPSRNCGTNASNATQPSGDAVFNALPRAPVSLVNVKQSKGSSTPAPSCLDNLKPRIIVTSATRPNSDCNEDSSQVVGDEDVAYKLLAATSEPLPIAVVLRDADGSGNASNGGASAAPTVSPHNPLLSARTTSSAFNLSTNVGTSRQTVQSTEQGSAGSVGPSTGVQNVNPTDVVIHNRLSNVKVAVDSIISSLDPIPLLPTSIQQQARPVAIVQQSSSSPVDLVCNNGGNSGSLHANTTAENVNTRMFELLDRVEMVEVVSSGADSVIDIGTCDSSVTGSSGVSSYAPHHASQPCKARTSASVAAKQNLNSIVEAIRHLEGDQLFLSATSVTNKHDSGATVMSEPHDSLVNAISLTTGTSNVAHSSGT